MNSSIGTPFNCNICGEPNIFNPIGDWREAPSCTTCGSSVRSRQITHCISLAVTGTSRCLLEVQRPDLTGVGLSDSSHLASALSTAFSYKNTFYHTAPILDICQPTEHWLGAADFLVSSDVFEHVPTPVSMAFIGAYNVLKPGGTIILTVPYDNRPDSTEHFPNVREFSITSVANEWLLVGKTERDDFEVHRNLVFHGGPGTTVEMRFFSKEALIKELRDAGFEAITIHSEIVAEYGVFPPHDQGLPITARKPL